MTATRISREIKTVQAMLALYCRKNHRHNSSRLCPDCQALLTYARNRLDHCPFQEGKTTCGKCPIHCYQPARRSQIKDVMRTIGPLMIWHHPFLALRHFIDGFRRSPRK